MDWAGWATFGLVATTVLTGIMAGAQGAGLSRMDMPMMLGTTLARAPDRARTLGFLMHVLNGQVFAVIYVAAFWLIGSASWLMGAAFGLAHGLLALTVVLPMLPGIHPRMASERHGPVMRAVLEPPGTIGLNYGIGTPVVTIVAHVVYGAILGGFITPHP